MTTHTLTTPRIRLTVDSTQGMRWLSGDIMHDNRWRPLLPDCTLAESGLKECNYLLLPYSNRIRDGKFSFQGRDFQLDNAIRHAIHGTLRDQSWQIEKASDTEITATVNSHSSDNFNWPWPISAVCNLSVQDSQINCTLQLTNHGGSAMPVGGGWHPYFVRQFLRENPHLTIPVDGLYPDNDGDCLPTAGPQALPEALNFRVERTLPPDQRIDHCFSGLQAPMQIYWPDADVRVLLQASANCTHAVLYNPDKPWFALEPVTHANDAINLQTTGIDVKLYI